MREEQSLGRVGGKGEGLDASEQEKNKQTKNFAIPKDRVAFSIFDTNQMLY